MAACSGKLRRNICIAVLLSITLLVILIVILVFTVFKPKQPTIAVDKVSLLDLNFSFIGGVDLNLSLMVELSIGNPNKVAFEYSDSTAIVSYRGEEVGEAPIPAGRLSAEGTDKMNLTLTMMADRMLGKPELFSDVVSGQLPISTVARLPGKVKVIGVFKIHVVASASCDLTIDVKSRGIGDQQCHYRTKL